MKIVEKLSAIQQTMKAPKNLRNTFGGYNYRNAESILEAFKPYEDEYKVALIVQDDIVLVGDRVYVKATATLYDNESDECISASAFAREAAVKKGMDEAQITGAASSYARKYALNGLLLLDDTKDADSDEYKKQDDAMAAVPKTSADLKAAIKKATTSKVGQVRANVWLKKNNFESVDKVPDENLSDLYNAIV